MKAGKFLKRCFVTICISLSLLGVFCAGKNAQALDLPYGSWSVIYDTASPAFKLDSEWNNCRNSSNHNFWVTGLSGYHTFHIYAGVECNAGNVYRLQSGDILIYQLAVIDGSIDLPRGIVAEPNLGFNLLGYEVSNTADDSSIYTFYVYYNGSAGGFNDLVDIGLSYRNYDNWGTGSTVSAVSVFRNTSGNSISPSDLATINNELSNCTNQQGGSDSTCVRQSVKKWIYDIWAQLNSNISPGLSTLITLNTNISNTATAISNNLINVKTILENIRAEIWNCRGDSVCESKYLKGWVYHISSQLDDLDTSIEDIASNSNEENETNKTEKDNIENQSAEDIGNTTDQKTESLMSSFGQFVAVFQSASPSNCRLHIDLGSHSGTNVDFGNVDLCSLPVPSFITIIGSIFLVLAVFAVLYHLINRILSLVREMQS